MHTERAFLQLLYGTDNAGTPLFRAFNGQHHATHLNAIGHQKSLTLSVRNTDAKNPHQAHSHSSKARRLARIPVPRVTGRCHVYKVLVVQGLHSRVAGLLRVSM